MLKDRSNQIYLYLIPLLLILLYTTEAYYKINEYYFGETSILLKSIKLIVLTAITIFILKTKPKALFWPLLLVLSFSIGQTLLNNPFQTEIIIEFGKFLYLILLLIFFNVYPLNKAQKNKLFLCFEMILVFNSLLILLGYFFDIGVFKTYEGNRFGFDGFLITSATGSYVYIIGLFFILLKYRYRLFYTPTNYIVVLSAFLVGTKALYIFIFGAACVYIFWFLKGKFKIILISLIGGIFIFNIYYFFFVLGIFNDIRQSDGLLSAVMSYRDQLLIEKTMPFIKYNWQGLNYFFGGISDLSTKSQIDIIDIFYCFGILGGILYLYVFLKLFLTFKTNHYMISLLCLMLLIVFFAGNFFSYASVAIYIILLREFLLEYEKS